MTRTFGLIVIGFLAAAMLAAAAESQEEKRLEPVVVTATKIETAAERLGAAVTVITEEDIERYRWQTVGDALQHVPGLVIQQSGGFGKTTAIRIRGASPQQVQVLVDGVRVKSPTAGVAELTDISIDQIERIEVVRGPQSTIYGADAIGGVVNIITRRGRGPFSPYASVELGNYDTHRERAGFSGSLGILDYSLGGAWFESGGRSTFEGVSGRLRNDGSEQGAVSSRLGLALPRDGHLGLSLRFTSTASELPFDGLTPTAQSPFFVLDPNAEQLSETLTVALEWTHKPVPWFELRARHGQFWNWLTFRDPATPADAAAGNLDLLFGETRSQIDVKRRETELVTAWHAGKWNTLTLGGEYRTESGTIDSTSGGFPTRVDERLHTGSGFVQDELRLFDRLILSGGRRWDDHSSFGSVATDRASAVFLVRETGSKLRGTWGEGFRAPTINDLFFPQFGNPDLKPERSESWDIGVDQRLWRDRVRLGITYFDNRFRDLIVFDPSAVPPACPPDAIFGCPVNIGRARTKGVEVAAAVDLLETLTVSGSYTYTDSKDLDTGDPLPRFPRHRYTAGLTWAPLQALSLFTEAQVVSSHFERGRPRNSGYHRIDLGGAWRIVQRRGAAPALDLTVRLNNVTDQDYMEVLGFPALGINVLAGLQARY